VNGADPAAGKGGQPKGAKGAGTSDTHSLLESGDLDAYRSGKTLPPDCYVKDGMTVDNSPMSQMQTPTLALKRDMGWTPERYREAKLATQEWNLAAKRWKPMSAKELAATQRKLDAETQANIEHIRIFEAQQLKALTILAEHLGPKASVVLAACWSGSGPEKGVDPIFLKALGKLFSEFQDHGAGGHLQVFGSMGYGLATTGHGKEVNVDQPLTGMEGRRRGTATENVLDGDTLTEVKTSYDYLPDPGFAGVSLQRTGADDDATLLHAYPDARSFPRHEVGNRLNLSINPSGGFDYALETGPKDKQRANQLAGLKAAEGDASTAFRAFLVKLGFTNALVAHLTPAAMEQITKVK
jgi:hypothetical protein